MDWDTCNACGKETWVRWLKLPDEEQLSEYGQYYCEPCFNLVKAQVMAETGEWDYGGFEFGK